VRAVDDFQRRSIGIPEIETRTIDRPVAPIFLEKDVDTLASQRVLRRLVLARVDHERVMDAVRHLRRTFLNGRRPLDQEQTDAACIQESDFLVRQLREELATDNLGVKFLLLSTSLTGILK